MADVNNVKAVIIWAEELIQLKTALNDVVDETNVTPDAQGELIKSKEFWLKVIKFIEVSLVALNGIDEPNAVLLLSNIKRFTKVTNEGGGGA